MVPYHICRQAALGIVQQLVLSTSGDDDMGTLLGLMHTAPVLALDLKTHILKVICKILCLDIFFFEYVCMQPLYVLFFKWHPFKINTKNIFQLKISLLYIHFKNTIIKYCHIYLSEHCQYCLSN